MTELSATVLNAIDGAVNKNSDPIQTRFLWKLSLQAIATGSATGTLKIQASNDPVYQNSPVPNVVTNWNDIASATITISSSTSFMLAPIDLCYNYIRLVYTKNSGAGTITANIKALGA